MLSELYFDRLLVYLHVVNTFFLQFNLNELSDRFFGILFAHFGRFNAV